MKLGSLFDGAGTCCFAAEYKMWENGMALPNVLYIFEGLAQCKK